MQLEVARWLNEGMFRDVSTNPAVQNLQCIPLHPRSTLFQVLSRTTKVVSAVQNLVGSPIVKILDQSFYKPAHSGIATSWHTDNAYFQMSDPLGGLAMWIAIHDASRENGCLKVLPNAFNKTFAHCRDPLSDHHIRTEIHDKDALYCELEAGGVVFFCFGTPHATGDNTTDQPRAGVGIHYVNTTRMDGLNAERWQQLDKSDSRSSSESDEEFSTLVRETISRGSAHLKPQEY